MGQTNYYEIDTGNFRCQKIHVKFCLSKNFIINILYVRSFGLLLISLFLFIILFSISFCFARVIGHIF